MGYPQMGIANLRDFSTKSPNQIPWLGRGWIGFSTGRVGKVRRLAAQASAR
jgi:hypothetical protein